MAGPAERDIDSLFRRGVEALQEGDLTQAETAFSAVLSEAPDHAPTLYNLGVVTFQRGDAHAAESLLRDANRVRPDHEDTLSVLVAVLLDQRKIDEAVQAARQILNLANASAPTLHAAAQAFAQAGQTAQAENVYRTALARSPVYRPATLALAALLSARRAFDDAAAVCAQALKLRPDDLELQLKRAEALWEGGYVDRAKEALLNLLDLMPDHVTALYNLSLYAEVPDSAANVARLKSLLSEIDLPLDDIAKAWFALGNHQAAHENWEEALACFSAGNAARGRAATVLHARSGEQFDKRVEHILTQPLPAATPGKDSDVVPLVICGASRSGKSLLQSWLSSDPEISAADEVGLLARLAETDCLTTPERRAEAAKAYLNTLRSLGGAGRYVVDTHPTNALYLDLLLALCPEARIIFIERDPCDAAVSIFARHSVAGGHWVDTWEGIAERLQVYRRLADHWQTHEAVVARLAFEEFVEAPGAAVFDIYDQLGLVRDGETVPEHLSQTGEAPVPWASFHTHMLPRTETIGLWRPFAPWLGAFANAFGREHLSDPALFPVAAHSPKSSFVSVIEKVRGGALAQDQDVEYATEPGVHRNRADGLEQKQDWSGALNARWAAV